MILICIKIFLARIVDVSLGTLRTVLIVHSSRLKGAIVAFFEVLIWFFVAREALNTDLDSILIPIFYAGGYAMGTYVGTFVSNAFVDGLIGVQVITEDSKSNRMQKEMRHNGFGLSVVDLKNPHDKKEKDMLIIQSNKKSLKKLTNIIRKNDPDAFVMINEIKHAQNGCVK